MALSQGRTECAPPALSWRPMTLADIDAVFEIALISFPDYFEGRECFENRLALNPSGCFVLVQGETKAHGYLVAYPWIAGAAPVLAALVLGLFVSLALGPNLDLLGVYGRVRFVALSNLAIIALTIGGSAATSASSTSATASSCSATARSSSSIRGRRPMK